MFNNFVVFESFQLTIQIEERYLRHTLICLSTDFNQFYTLILICINVGNPCLQKYVVAKGRRWFKAILQACLSTSVLDSQNSVELLAVNILFAVLDAFRSRISSRKFSSTSGVPKLWAMA